MYRFIAFSVIIAFIGFGIFAIRAIVKSYKEGVNQNLNKTNIKTKIKKNENN